MSLCKFSRTLRKRIQWRKLERSSIKVFNKKCFLKVLKNFPFLGICGIHFDPYSSWIFPKLLIFETARKNRNMVAILCLWVIVKMSVHYTLKEKHLLLSGFVNSFLMVVYAKIYLVGLWTENSDWTFFWLKCSQNFLSKTRLNVFLTDNHYK